MDVMVGGLQHGGPGGGQPGSAASGHAHHRHPAPGKLCCHAGQGQGGSHCLFISLCTLCLVPKSLPVCFSLYTLLGP